MCVSDAAHITHSRIIRRGAAASTGEINAAPSLAETNQKEAQTFCKWDFILKILPPANASASVCVRVRFFHLTSATSHI